MQRITIKAASVLALASALLAAACDKECAPVAQTGAAADQMADIRRAAETSIRVSASNPDAVRFRGVQVWPQAIKNQFAVCGQANVFGPTSNTFVLFVAVVTRDEFNQDPARKFKAEARVGSTVTEATKVYVDALARCFEGGGPQNQRRDSVPPLPPLPQDVQAVLAGPAPAAPPPAAAPVPAAPTPGTAALQPATSAASGTVVMRQNGNIRSSPQGDTLRVEPAGKELRVFGEGPGGWLQVGTGSQPDGWVHSSLVQRR
ncbi:MAG: SH3 domain-containing protein [Acetobacteraceae bacterium]|nr:SH3 domain-containing protein [Pseudomonadota bacterium]